MKTLRVYFVVWLAIIAAFVAATAQSNPPVPSGAKPAQPPQQQSATNQSSAAILQRGTESAPIVVRLEKTQVDEQRANDDKRQAEEKASSDRLQLCFNGLLVLCAAFQIGLFIWQVRLAKGFGREQRRAYVSCGIHTIAGFDTANPPSIRLYYTNHGSTPAKNVRFRADFGLAPNPVPPADDFPAIISPWIGPPFDLFPNTEVAPSLRIGATATAIQLFSAEDIQRIRQETSRYYIAVEIEYWDVFGDRHITLQRVCVESDPARLQQMTSNLVVPDLRTVALHGSVST